MDSSEAPGPQWNAAGAEGARDTWTKGCLAPEEVSGTSCSLGSSPKVLSGPASAQEAFTSSFSFIQLSLSSAGERGEAEGCPPCREAEDTEAKAAGLDRPLEGPRLFSTSFSLQAAQGPADSAQTAGASPRPECEPLAVLDTDPASSCPSDPSRFEGAALHWDLLLRKCEPLLLDCLLSNRRQLEVGVSPASGPHECHTLRLALGRGQETSGSGVDRLPPKLQQLLGAGCRRTLPRFRFSSSHLSKICSPFIYPGI